MIARQPRGPGSRRLAEAIQKLRGAGRPAGASDLAGHPRGPGRFDREPRLLDCQRPDAPADLPTIHGLQLAAIEGRLLKLEQQVSNQNRILLIGVIALVGDIVRQLLRP